MSQATFESSTFAALGADIPAPFFFCAPQRLLFGEGSRHRLAALLQRLGWQRIAFVCDPYFAAPGAAGMLLFEELAAAGIACTLYGGCRPDPSLAGCDAAREHLAAAGSGFDCVVALGGGSTMDLAKVLCLTLPHGGPAARFAGCRIDLPPLPLVALPTTAGTASELTPGAILVAADGQAKVAVMDNSLRASAALVDPELTLSCPSHVTADAGLDALTHAIESFLTQDSAEFDTGGDPDPGYSGRSVMTRLFARESIRLCQAHLRTAYSQPGDRTARRGMALASIYAGMSYASAGLHAVHALAYGVAALTHAPHGTTNAVMLPYVMNALGAQRHGDLAEIACLLGAAPAGTTPDDAAHAAAGAVRELVAAVGMATDLRALGVRQDQLPAIVRGGLDVQRLTKAFPGGDAEARYTRIVRAAFDGSLA